MEKLFENMKIIYNEFLKESENFIEVCKNKEIENNRKIGE